MSKKYSGGHFALNKFKENFSHWPQILKELDSNNKNLDRDEEKITELERKVEG